MSYAVFRTAGKQFRAEKGVTMKVPQLEGEPGAKVTFDDVLLASDGQKVKAGTPTVKGAKVTAQIVRHGKGDKVVVYKFRRRENYRRKQGHRQGFGDQDYRGEGITENGRHLHGSQERRRLQPQRPRFEPAVPGREAVWRAVRPRRQHSSAATRDQVPSGQERAPRYGRHVVRRGGRPGHVREQEQEALPDKRLPGSGGLKSRKRALLSKEPQ